MQQRQPLSEPATGQEMVAVPDALVVVQMVAVAVLAQGAFVLEPDYAS